MVEGHEESMSGLGLGLAVDVGLNIESKKNGSKNYDVTGVDSEVSNVGINTTTTTTTTTTTATNNNTNINTNTSNSNDYQNTDEVVVDEPFEPTTEASSSTTFAPDLPTKSIKSIIKPASTSSSSTLADIISTPTPAAPPIRQAP